MDIDSGHLSLTRDMDPQYEVNRKQDALWWLFATAIAMGAVGAAFLAENSFVGVVLYCMLIGLLWLAAFGHRQIPEILLGVMSLALIANLAFFALSAELRPIGGTLILVAPPLAVIASRRGVGVRRELPAIALWMTGLAALSFAVASLPAARIVEILSWGFDSYNHVNIFLAFQEVGTFFALEEVSLLNVMSWVPDYPAGHWALWNSLAVGSNQGPPFDPTFVLSIYALFTSLSGIALVCVSVIAANRLVKPRIGRIPQAGIVASVVVLTIAFVVFGNFSHLLWSGFPSLILGMTIVVCYLAITSSCATRPVSWPLFTMLAFAATAITYPLLLPAIGAIAIGNIKAVRKSIRFTSRSYWLAGIAAIVLVALFLSLFVARTAGQFVNTLLAPGGIEPIPTFLLAAMLLLASWTVVFHIRHDTWFQASVVGIYGVFAAVLATYSWVVAGFITYYPTRVLYMFQLLLFILVLAQVFSVMNRRDRVVTSVLAFLFVGTSLYYGFHPVVYRGAPMGATPAAIDSVVNGTTGSSICGELTIDAVEATRDFPDVIPVVLAESEQGGQYLTTSWPLSLAGKMNDDMWLLATSISDRSKPESMGEVIRDWRNKTGRNERILLIGSEEQLRVVGPALADDAMIESLIRNCPTSQGSEGLKPLQPQALPTSVDAWVQESAVIAQISQGKVGLEMTIVSSTSNFPNVRTTLSTSSTTYVRVSGSVGVGTGQPRSPYVALVWKDSTGNVLFEVNSASTGKIAAEDGLQTFDIAGSGPQGSESVELVLLGGTVDGAPGQDTQFVNLGVLVSD